VTVWKGFKVKIRIVNYRKPFFVALVVIQSFGVICIQTTKIIFRNEIERRIVENTNVVH